MWAPIELVAKMKGQVSTRGVLWYLNILIILWEQIVIYRGHASMKFLNQMELVFVCIIY